jgi:hypothetical protein
MGEVATIQEHRAPLMAGGRVQAIVPQSMEEAYRLATAVCKAGMAPKGLDTPEKAMIAIMHGMEIGLTPMSALQRIAVVNGRPTIWGDAAIGLVRGSGLCEYVKESVAGEGKNRTALCAAKRKGEAAEIVRTFGVVDAERAGLWGKQGPWTQYPDRMLQMRARAFALRDLFADVLGGLYLREEIDDDRPMRDVTPPPAPTPTPPPAPQITAQPEPVAEAEVVKLLPPEESAALKEGLLKRLGKVGTTKALNEWIKSAGTAIATMQEDDRIDLQEEWDAKAAHLYEAEQDEPQNIISGG